MRESLSRIPDTGDSASPAYAILRGQKRETKR